MKHLRTSQPRYKDRKFDLYGPKKHQAASQAILQMRPRISSPLAPGENNLRATERPALLRPSFKPRRAQSLYRAALRAAMAATPMGRDVLAGHARLLSMTPKDHDDWDAYVYGTGS